MPTEEELDELIQDAQNAAEEVLTKAAMSADEEIEAYEQLIENMRDELGVRRASLRDEDDDEEAELETDDSESKK